ncbi:MAG: carboxypeptidase regulatory-like domain-containing protein [Candidatus Rokuibacteriota bacterium]
MAVARFLLLAWLGLLAGPLPATVGYVEAPVVDGGVVVGRVRFQGEPVKGDPVPVRKNIDVCGESKPFQALLVGADKGVRNTVVYLEGVERGKKPADFELDNAKCLFVPHVSAVMVGAKVRVKNADPILHNTHGFVDRLTVFNIALPYRDQVVDITQRIKKVGVIEVQCDAHTHMRAWIVVRDNPYVAVSDDSGQFRIADVPPGRYKVVAWHEGWLVTGRDKDGRPVYDAPRVVTREVTVPARGEVTVDFDLN